MENKHESVTDKKGVEKEENKIDFTYGPSINDICSEGMRGDWLKSRHSKGEVEIKLYCKLEPNAS